ncbi:MAG: murein hydrolase activator EnvC family protein [Melioribacteraceae bacterium]
MQKSLSGKYFFICLIVAASILQGQTKDTIRLKNQELDKVKKEISALEKELQSKSKKERESLKALENINQQNLLLNKLVNNLLTEEKQKEEAIQQIENEITKVKSHTDELKEKYARYIVWLYKNRGLSIWRFIFDSDSFNQAINRYRYLRYISNQNKTILDQLDSSKIELSGLKNDLEGERREKESLAKQKMNEQENLRQKESEKKELLTVLKKDQKIITQEIASKRMAEITIKNLIAKLIEVDRERRAKMHEQKATDKKSLAYKKNIQMFDYSGFENFAELRGKLGWPIREGKIVRTFGENKNERLKTVTLNYGIDIAVKGDEKVLSVAEGIVSAIDWLPGYGSILIITHRDDFRTVYGHISDISVKEGDKVKSGTAIGKVNESLEGNILHFEIWNERNYQNPEVWLARK